MRARQGDHFAGAEIYRHYVPSVRRYMRAALSRKEDAEDATQQVFLKLFEALPRYHSTQPFASWLFTLVRNVAIDAQRRSGHAQAFERAGLPNAGVEEPSGANAPSVREMVTMLPHLQQEALILLYEEDLSAAEAGKRLGRSADATRQLHSRALKRLAACLAT